MKSTAHEGRFKAAPPPPVTVAEAAAAETAAAEAAASERHGLLFRLKRATLISAMTVTSLNVWTGSPLAALWIGSRLQGNGPPTMGAIGAVAVAMAAISLGLLRALGRLGDAYDKLIGLPERRKQHSPWLRSLRGEREDFKDPERNELSPLDIVMCSMVIIVVIAFEIWFFFFSASPIDQRTGR
jgi:hypothetical protein